MTLLSIARADWHDSWISQPIIQIGSNIFFHCRNFRHGSFRNMILVFPDLAFVPSSICIKSKKKKKKCCMRWFNIVSFDGGTECGAWKSKLRMHQRIKHKKAIYIKVSISIFKSEMNIDEQAENCGITNAACERNSNCKSISKHLHFRAAFSTVLSFRCLERI